MIHRLVRAVSLVAKWAVALGLAAGASCAPGRFDVLLRGGVVYDGTGAPGRRVDVAIRGDKIAAIGELAGRSARRVLDLGGLAVSPGFINVLSWAVDTLIIDGRGKSDIFQGVTTEIFGEGSSMGPLTPAMKKTAIEQQGTLKYDIRWTTLREYLDYLERKGVSPNVASFIGAATIREYVVGLDDRRATPVELEAMRALVRREMTEGALGIGSALIYPPGTFANTEELLELCKVAASYGGRYISHIRGEGARLLEALQELIRISREAGLPAEIYHLKAAGRENWTKMDQAIQLVEEARRAGLPITANMYPYSAGATGYDACVPRWAMAGGEEALYKRLGDPAVRARIAREMETPSAEWENWCLLAGSPERVLFLDLRSPALKPLAGKTLAEVARARGKSWSETLLDLILEDRYRIMMAFFVASPENLRKVARLPWVSFGSDAPAPGPEGIFLQSPEHPRAYGTFARVLGRFVRDEKLIPLAQALHKMTGLPAKNVGLDRRGFLQEGMFADVVVFDPATIRERATYTQPHQLAVGVRHVFVNGTQVLRDGQHTGALPGRALRRVGTATKR